MLKYVGNGAALPDVPARDLSKEDVQALAPEVGLQVLTARLLKSGLYELAEPQAKAKKEVK
jgi:hypothetical protein